MVGGGRGSNINTALWMQPHSSSLIQEQTSLTMLSMKHCTLSSQLSGHEWQENSIKTMDGISMLSSDLERESKPDLIWPCSTSVEDIPTYRCHEDSKTCWNTSLRTEISKTMDQYLQRQTRMNNSSTLPKVVNAMGLTNAVWRIAYRSCGQNTYGNATDKPVTIFSNLVQALNACSCRPCSSLTSQLSLSDHPVVAKALGQKEYRKNQHSGSHTWTTSRNYPKNTNASSLTTWTSNTYQDRHKSTWQTKMTYEPSTAGTQTQRSQQDSLKSSRQTATLSNKMKRLRVE